MSLEQALQENTAALLALTATIKAAGLSTSATTEPKTKEEPAKSEVKAEPVKPADPAPANASADPVDALAYADIQKPFLKLVNANKAKAVELLAELGVPTLKEFADKSDRWAEVLKRIQEASNG